MFELLTNFPIAFDSPDHLMPLGTKKDNSRNHRFIKKCEEWLQEKKIKKGTILDMGCAGGGCVEDFAALGHDVYGLEGSDYSQKIKRAAWRTIPDRLYTCDISRPFSIYLNNRPATFDLIFSFDVMEHIKKSRLQTYFQNIYNHLADESLFIGTFTSRRSNLNIRKRKKHPEMKYPKHHQTVMTKKQWYRFIKKLGLFTVVGLKWKKKDYLRYSLVKENCIPISFQKKLNSNALVK